MHHVSVLENTIFNRTYVYIVDGTVMGGNDSDHEWYFINDYLNCVISCSVTIPKIFLESAAYLKNRFVIWWAGDMKAQGRLDTWQNSVPLYSTEAHKATTGHSNFINRKQSLQKRKHMRSWTFDHHRCLRRSSSLASCTGLAMMERSSGKEVCRTSKSYSVELLYCLKIFRTSNLARIQTQHQAWVYGKQLWGDKSTVFQ